MNDDIMIMVDLAYDALDHIKYNQDVKENIDIIYMSLSEIERIVNGD